MFSGGIAAVPPVNFTWLFWKVFTSLRLTGTGTDSSRFFIFAIDFSLSSAMKKKEGKSKSEAIDYSYNKKENKKFLLNILVKASLAYKIKQLRQSIMQLL